MNNPLILAGLVGLALVCGGLLIFAFIFLFRFAGEHSVEFFSFLAHESREDDGREDRRFIRSPKPNLRSIAQAQDFDSALARQVIHNEFEPPNNAPHTANPPIIITREPPPPSPTDSLPFPDAQPRLRSRRSTRLDSSDGETDDDF